MEGDNISAAFPNASLSINGVGLTGKELFAIITAFCVLPTVWLRNLSLLSYISGKAIKYFLFSYKFLKPGAMVLLGQMLKMC